VTKEIICSDATKLADRVAPDCEAQLTFGYHNYVAERQRSTFL
jgi:hypothetical protein